ncbi:lycopene cyclase domain-containing protein (plasmid) [Coraliomargarita sp. W4R53]
MTYALIILPFAAITAVVVAISAIRPQFGTRMLASAIAAAALCVLTAVFDNLMIAADLFTYPSEHLSGIYIGLAPIEDFSYAVCAAFIVPAIYSLLERRPNQKPSNA